MARAKSCCIPCLHPDVKAVIQEAVKDRGIRLSLEEFADCPDGTLLDPCYMKGAGKKDGGTRPRSAYQEFVSGCMKSKHIKGFGEAPKAMKDCAAQWRSRKGK
jgi:hypothetical protein